MKFAATTFALVLAASVGSAAFAADKAPAAGDQAATKELPPRQQRMKDCNAQAGDKNGDERKAFMSTCLKSTDASATTAATTATTGAVAGPPSAPKRPQQAQREKMKTCNADANTKHLKGDDRKTFMSTCLKGDKAAAAAH